MNIKPLTKEQREKMEAENKRWAEVNEKHRAEHKDDWVFERMEMVENQNYKWGEPRVRE